MIHNFRDTTAATPQTQVHVLHAELLFKQTKKQNKFIQANSTRYFLKIVSSTSRKIKICTLRNKKPGTNTWNSIQDGEIEKVNSDRANVRQDNPHVEEVSPDQTNYVLKINKNSFQDEEGSRRSRSQVTTREDLFQFRVVISDNDDTITWISDAFYVLSCSKKDAKEW